MLDSYDIHYQNIHSDNIYDETIQLTQPEKQKLQDDLKQVQEEISDLRKKLSLKLQHEAELKTKLGYTLLNDIKSGLKTVKDSATYAKTVNVLTSIKEKTSSAAVQTKEVVSKNLQIAKNSNIYKEVGIKVDSFVSTLKGAFYQVNMTPAIGEKEPESQTPAQDVNTGWHQNLY